MERGTLNELQSQIKHSILFACVVDGYDVGMIEHSGSAGFILETAENIFSLQPMHVHPHGF